MVQIDLYSALFFLFLLIFILNFVYLACSFPYGEWDAWAFWNLKAKYLYLSGSDSDYAFKSLRHTSNPDYPLLLPLLVSRAFAYMGHASASAPVSIGLIFALAMLATVPSAIAFVRRSSRLGYLAGIALLSMPSLAATASYQYAEIPLTFFTCIALIMLFVGFIGDPQWPAILLSGFFAASAAWTKNEGLLLFVSMGISILFYGKRKSLMICIYLLGAAPILMILLYFKFFVAASSAIFFGQNSTDLVHKMFEVHRYGLVLFHISKALITHAKMLLIFIAGLIILLILVGVQIPEKEKSSARLLILTLCLMLSGYFLIYVISPYDLNWHISSSVVRLVLQLVPISVFLAFVLLKKNLKMPTTGYSSPRFAD